MGTRPFLGEPCFEMLSCLVSTLRPPNFGFGGGLKGVDMRSGAGMTTYLGFADGVPIMKVCPVEGMALGSIISGFLVLGDTGPTATAELLADFTTIMLSTGLVKHVGWITAVALEMGLMLARLLAAMATVEHSDTKPTSSMFTGLTTLMLLTVTERSFCTKLTSSTDIIVLMLSFGVFANSAFSVVVATMYMSGTPPIKGGVTELPVDTREGVTRLQIILALALDSTGLEELGGVVSRLNFGIGL